MFDTNAANKGHVYPHPSFETRWNEYANWLSEHEFDNRVRIKETIYQGTEHYATIVIPKLQSKGDFARVLNFHEKNSDAYEKEFDFIKSYLARRSLIFKRGY